MLSLILGGARSGKSAYAEQLALQSGREVVYLATAQAGDAEMQARIAHHQQRRSSHWILHEQSLDLAQALQALDGAQRVILVDCLTLWLSNILFADGAQYAEDGPVQPLRFAAEKQALLSVLPQMQADVILVSNETGMGIVPLSAATRWFVDEAGRLHQALAQLSENVVLVAAGLPLTLKSKAG